MACFGTKLSLALVNAGGDDDAFYSPKSSASFSSDASFGSADNLGRSPFDDDGDMARASSGMVSSLQSSGRDLRAASSPPGPAQCRRMSKVTIFALYLLARS